jgi:hypothetical protein
MNLLLIYKALVTLAPIARVGIEYAQALIPEKGQGMVRKAIVKAHLGQAFDDMKIAAIKFEDVWPKLERDIDEAVPVLKSLGILTNTAGIDAALKTLDKVAGEVAAITGAGAAAQT